MIKVQIVEFNFLFSLSLPLPPSLLYMQILRLYAQYRQAEVHRKGLVFQKHYLQCHLDAFYQTQQVALLMLADMGAPINPGPVFPPPSRFSRPYARFRAVGAAVRAVFRFRYMCRRKRDYLQSKVDKLNLPLKLNESSSRGLLGDVPPTNVPIIADSVPHVTTSAPIPGKTSGIALATGIPTVLSGFGVGSLPQVNLRTQSEPAPGHIRNPIPPVSGTGTQLSFKPSHKKKSKATQVALKSTSKSHRLHKGVPYSHSRSSPPLQPYPHSRSSPSRQMYAFLRSESKFPKRSSLSPPHKAATREDKKRTKSSESLKLKKKAPHVMPSSSSAHDAPPPSSFAHDDPHLLEYMEGLERLQARLSKTKLSLPTSQ